jgi:dipeptidyl-peptidase-4
MHRNFKGILALAVLLPLSGLLLMAQPSGVKTAGNRITLEDIWMKYRFFPKYAETFNWMKDDKYYTVLEEGKLVKYSVESQQAVETLLDLATVRNPVGDGAITAEGYSFSDDEAKVLLTSGSEPIYRRSSKEVCYVVDLKSKNAQVLHDGKPVSFATFSPDGSKIAYKFENNLFIQDLGGKSRTQVTTDGKWNEIINGGTDWVYEEEFSFTRAFFWSPDNARIAYYKFDESNVKEFSMAMYGQLYPDQYNFKYPKAGEANSVVTLHLYDVATKKTIKADIGTEKDQYIPRINWTQNPKSLAVMRMNRLQNKLELLLVDGVTGKSSVILTENEDTYIDEVTDTKWVFLDNGKEFLWQMEADGHNHYYLYDFTGKQIRQITKGSWDVTQFCTIDEKASKLYFMSTVAGATERHLCSVNLDGSDFAQLTHTAGWHDVEFSSGSSYYLDSYSTIHSAPVTGLFDKTGKEIAMLEKNEALQETMGKLTVKPAEFFTFTNSDGIALNGYMIKPVNLEPGKKYPVLMHCYGGPGHQTVRNQFLGFDYFYHQMLAQEGIIVVSVDGRGTGGRGEEFKKSTYGNLGMLEAMDQISAAQYLASLDYIDGSRIAIWGWSFGGYLSSLCITKGADVFKAAIAVAPVTNWRYYDTIYTERYLKTPQLNAGGYDDNSPINFVDKLKGKYLLVHGTADDNVHFQNSVEMTDALVKANKQFDMAFYPNKNHGIYGGTTRFHLYKKMYDFLKVNL